MAEIAIPIALLGGMFILSNNSKSKKESFHVNRHNKGARQNMTADARQNMKHTNFPINGTSQLKQDPGYYPSSESAMDKYFDKDKFDSYTEGNKTADTYTSLDGKHKISSDIKHDNMVPFFGSRVRQSEDRNINESRLDNMNGNGSQHFKKQEIAPLFKPKENISWAHGTPNTSDFIQSRMNPSMSMANVKPFEEIRVGPGVSGCDGISGSGGFNAGMQARDKWIPKTVDELRVKTNPKVSYGGVMLGGKNRVTNRGSIGHVEKNRPETYYNNGPERYMTTTGIEKAQTTRSSQVMPIENRETTTSSYYGGGTTATTESTYVPGSYLPAKRAVLESNDKHMSNLHAANKHNASSTDYGMNGYKDSVLPNNRTLTTNRQPEYGIVSSFTKAIITPIMDILRPTRKENVVGNIRTHGNAGRDGINAAYVYNPNDKTKTTIREMTENRKQHNFISNQQETGGYGYTVSENQAYEQNRDTTNTKYTGNAGAINEAPKTYDSAYNANLIDKTPFITQRAPAGSNVKVFNGQTNTNIQVSKLECDRNNNRMFVPQNLGKSSISSQHIGKSSTRTEYGQGVNSQRNSRDILNAFRDNPYTKPLDSVA